MSKFRVVKRTAWSDKTDDEVSVVWQGQDPEKYAGGYGTFDEGDRHTKISFEVQHSDGSWVDLKGDPRTDQAVGVLRPNTAVIVELGAELDRDRVRWVAGRFQISAEDVKSWQPTFGSAMSEVAHMLKHGKTEVVVRDLSRYDRRLKIVEL
jgi:hypothetical protein